MLLDKRNEILLGTRVSLPIVLNETLANSFCFKKKKFVFAPFGFRHLNIYLKKIPVSEQVRSTGSRMSFIFDFFFVFKHM